MARALVGQLVKVLGLNREHSDEVMRRIKGRDHLQGCGQGERKPGKDDRVGQGVIITLGPKGQL